jgi:hypothetical protein
VAALTARDHGPGRYLVCDIGAAGVRVAALDVADSTVRTVAVHASGDGGWREFEASVRALLTGAGDPLPPDWYLGLSGDDEVRRARFLFGRVASNPGAKESPVYTLAGPHGPLRLLAGQLIDCFAATREEVQAGLARALASGPADVMVLAGGLGWLPLAEMLLAEHAAAASVVVAEPEAAASGALLLASGTVQQAAPDGLVPVTLPDHRIRNGVLAEVSVAVPWTEPYASPPDGPLLVEEPELTVDVGDRRLTVPLPGLVPGGCLVGVRSGWSGAGTLVVRPVTGAGEPIVASIGTVTGAVS